MAAVRFTMDVTKTGHLGSIELGSSQLRQLGINMVDRQKERWSRGINAEGHQARPLAPVTAKGKRTFGKKPIRDMDMTGLTRENFSLRAWAQGVLRAENTSRAGRMHARKAQIFEHMIGISPQERDAVFTDAYRMYEAYLKTIWKPTS